MATAKLPVRPLAPAKKTTGKTTKVTSRGPKTASLRASAAARKHSSGIKPETAKKVTQAPARTSPAAPHAAPVSQSNPITPYVLRPSDRQFIWYVTRVGNRFMESATEGVLTDDLQSAKVSTRLKEQELLTSLGQINGKDTWDAVPVIESLKVSRSGVVSGTQASNLLPELTSNWASSRWHNLALSESAAAEAKNDETIFGHGLELKLSAMWPARNNFV